MNQMEIFKNPEFGSVRVIEENGKYLFCGVDVAKALGYTKPQNAIDRHCPHALKRGIGVKTGKKADGTPAVQMVEMLFIPEGDVYRLIVHSKLPSAERFERWVFDEVLPSIRKHGAYMTKEKLWEVATSPEALMKLCSDLLAEREKNAALRADNARLKGKAAYYDLFIDLHHSTNLRTTAKELVVPERQFVRFLLEQRFVYRTPSGCVLPYAKSSNEGLFCVKDYYRNGHSGSYTLVTPKGKQTVKQLIGQNQGVSNIEINDPSIKEFEKIARKYGVDYAVKKDRSSSPPKYLIFFKARDADALTAAFSEYTQKKVKKADRSERPSVLAKLSHFKALIKNAVVDRNKRKELER